MNAFNTLVIRSLPEFEACHAQWHDLYNRSCQHQATARHEMVVAYWQAFLSTTPVQVHVITESTSGRWIAALPTYQNRLWRMLPTAQNFSSPWCLGLTGLLSSEHDTTLLVEQLLTSVGKTGSMMLTLDLVSHEDHFVKSLTASRADGTRLVNLLELFSVGKTMIEPTWEAFTQDWSKKRRRFIRRACDQLSDVGRYQMQPLHSAAWSDVESAWAACLQVESCGWKGREGSDLASNSPAKMYYETLLRSLYQSGELRFYALELEGRLIAYDLGYLKQRVATSLKVSYHPDYTDYSPGHVLNRLVIQDLIEKQEADWIDTVGELNDANSKWCRESYQCQRIELSLDHWASRTTVRSREWLRAIKRRVVEKSSNVTTAVATDSTDE